MPDKPRIGTYQEQPLAAIDKAEEEERPNQDPPYEANNSDAIKHPHSEAPPGEVHDFRETREERDPDLPEIEQSDDPTGGVDRRRQAGDQGDDDVRGFHDE